MNHLPSSPSKQSFRSQSGLTLLELLISMSIISVIVVGMSMKVQGLRKNLIAVSSLMALDAFEASLVDFMGNEGVVRHSIGKAVSQTLRDCFVNQRLCRHGQGFRIDLFREGQSEAFTGEKVFYNREAQLCAERCEGGYQVKTAVVPQCINGMTCAGPAYILLVADIYRTGENKPLRHVVRELERNAKGKFPGLRLTCPQAEGVLYGIGLQGEALCVPRQEIILKDSNNKALGPISAIPIDCRALNTEARDQHFVNAIEASGKINCAPRFW